MFDLESAIDDWKQSIGDSDAVSTEEALELESHLRDLVSDLSGSGLSQREAFLVATDRIGHPAELIHEFAKIETAAKWRRRVLWMLTGYVVMSVGGSMVSMMVSITATGMGLSGMGGATTGAAMVALQALGWGGLLALLYRQSQHTGGRYWQLSLKWNITAVALLTLSPLLATGGNILRSLYSDMTHFGYSSMINALGGWVIHIAVCVTCLILMHKLSEASQDDAKASL